MVPLMNRSKVHRASAQRRRASLLEAAADLSAEVGAGSVTHRAIAARADVPLSTTSYFFESIGEIMTEALRGASAARVDDFDTAERAALLDSASTDEVISAVAASEVGGSRTVQAAQVEFYLAAGRTPELRPEVALSLTRLAERIQIHLDRRGAPQAGPASTALLSLADGEMLHRLSGVDLDHMARLIDGVRIVLAAAQLTDDEITALLARYDT